MMNAILQSSWSCKDSRILSMAAAIAVIGRSCAMDLETTLWVKAVYIHRLHISTPRIAKPL